MKHSFSNEQLISAINSSTSYRQVLQKLNIIPAGGNYRTLKLKISKLNLDTSHFKGQGWNKGKKHPEKQRPLIEYLTNKYPISSHSLRKRLIKEKLLEPKCSSCNLDIWMNKSIPLELDHINGNHTDNRLKNLRILCPNCHAQTPTYRRSKYSLKLKCH